jgi:superfamily II DNA/RNA helicase
VFVVAPSLPHVDILVANPLTLVAALRHAQRAATVGSLPPPAAIFPSLRFLIMDEADKLLELGFLEQVDEILSAARGASATVSSLPAHKEATKPAGLLDGDSTLLEQYLSDHPEAALSALKAAGVAETFFVGGASTTGSAGDEKKAVAPVLTALGLGPSSASASAVASSSSQLSRGRLVCGLFSATLPSSIETLIAAVLRDPLRIICGNAAGAGGAGAAASSSVKQQLVFVGREDGKILALKQMVQKGLKPPVLIFVQSKERAVQLHKALLFEGLNCDAIHADRTPAQREEAITKFRRGETLMLITTDLLGRGMDFKAVKVVVNFDFPQSAVSYVHRIGRTGRGRSSDTGESRTGEAYTLFTEDDIPMLRSIANVMRFSGCDVPQWMLEIKKMDRKEKKRVEKMGGAISERKAIWRDKTAYDARKEKEARLAKKKFKQVSGSSGSSDTAATTGAGEKKHKKKEGGHKGKGGGARE